MESNKQSGPITLFSETDKHGRILFANEAFCELSKFTHDELIGKPHNIIRHPDMPGRLFEVLWNTIGSGNTFRGTIKNRAKDGTPYWVQCTIMPIVDNQNSILKYISVRHLITDEELAIQQFTSQMETLDI